MLRENITYKKKKEVFLYAKWEESGCVIGRCMEHEIVRRR